MQKTDIETAPDPDPDSDPDPAPSQSYTQLGKS
jgi:hypothetical protein